MDVEASIYALLSQLSKQPLWLLTALRTESGLQGLGYEILAQVLEILSPSHVLQLLTTNVNNNLPAYHWWPDDTAGYNHPVMYQLPSVTALHQASEAAVSGAPNCHAAMCET